MNILIAFACFMGGIVAAPFLIWGVLTFMDWRDTKRAMAASLPLPRREP